MNVRLLQAKPLDLLNFARCNRRYGIRKTGIASAVLTFNVVLSKPQAGGGMEMKQTIGMSFEQKFEAMQSLDRDICIRLTETKDPEWYVSGNLSVVEDGMETCLGFGKTVSLAVEEAWKELTDPMKEAKLYVKNKGYEYFKWQGFMWKQTRTNYFEEKVEA
jgi:hypothetical protein